MSPASRLLALAFGLTGCAGGEEGAAAGDFEPLVTSEWTLPPPTGPDPDVYRCIRRTVTSDLLIAGLRPLTSSGVHHLLLAVGEPDGPDGESDCDFATIRTGLIYAAAIGTEEFLFPDRVALRVRAGQQLLLNVHLFNATDGPLSGTAGVAIRRADEEELEAEAEMVLAGTFRIDLAASTPPVEATVVGRCRLDADATILDWFPHMHRLGRHMTIELDGQVVHDADFLFREQRHYPTELAAQAGDEITVSCTYLNDTGAPVGFGESSNDEMCFAGLFRYPALGEGFCTDGFR